MVEARNAFRDSIISTTTPPIPFTAKLTCGWNNYFVSIEFNIFYMQQYYHLKWRYFARPRLKLQLSVSTQNWNCYNLAN